MCVCVLRYGSYLMPCNKRCPTFDGALQKSVTLIIIIDRRKTSVRPCARLLCCVSSMASLFILLKSLPYDQQLDCLHNSLHNARDCQDYEVLIRHKQQPWGAAMTASPQTHTAIKQSAHQLHEQSNKGESDELTKWPGRLMRFVTNKPILKKTPRDQNWDHKGPRQHLINTELK